MKLTLHPSGIIFSRGGRKNNSIVGTSKMYDLNIFQLFWKIAKR